MLYIAPMYGHREMKQSPNHVKARFSVELRLKDRLAVATTYLVVSFNHLTDASVFSTAPNAEDSCRLLFHSSQTVALDRSESSAALARALRACMGTEDKKL